MTIKRLAAWIFGALLLGGCVASPAAPRQEGNLPVSASPQARVALTVTPGSPIPMLDTAAPKLESPSPPPPSVPPRPTREATIPAAPLIITPGTNADLAGLIYELKDGQGVFLVQADGASRLITNENNPVFSPDLRYALHHRDYDGEIWLTDLEKNASINLTNTIETFETTFQWWPANPTLVVFTAQPLSELGYAAGKLGVMNRDGSPPKILDQQASYSKPAPSPDGKTIAYDREGQPWLWHADRGSEPLDPNLAEMGITSVTSPAWSPDGALLAWKVFGNNREWIAVGIFDLGKREWSLLHRYSTQSMGDVISEITWSPDGKWITTVNQGEENDDDLSLWILALHGSEAYRLGDGNNVIWRPDAGALAFYLRPSSGQNAPAPSLAWVQTGVWQAVSVKLADGAVARDWVSLPR